MAGVVAQGLSPKDEQVRARSPAQRIGASQAQLQIRLGTGEGEGGTVPGRKGTDNGCRDPRVRAREDTLARKSAGTVSATHPASSHSLDSGPSNALHLPRCLIPDPSTEAAPTYLCFGKEPVWHQQKALGPGCLPEPAQETSARILVALAATSGRASGSPGLTRGLGHGGAARPSWWRVPDGPMRRVHTHTHIGTAGPLWTGS